MTLPLRKRDLNEFTVAVKARLCAAKMSPNLSRTDLVLILGCFYIEDEKPGIRREQEAASLISARRMLTQ